MKITALIPTALVALFLGGCIVAPPVVHYRAPPNVVYIGPTYEIPAPGYVWEYHPQHGWGWHHPQYGWHRGWH